MDATEVERAHAKSAGLRYVDDRGPGISRKRSGSSFAFFDPKGKRISDAVEIARIKALAIPPAYEDVWICPSATGHVQATARDAKGRKQYRYHKRWREVRDATKYEDTIAFGAALPLLRARIERDLKATEMTRDRVLAAIVRMLDETHIRVGNETYARDNGSYGLTTLRNRHVSVSGEKRIRLKFRGKSGVEHAMTIEDRRVAKTIKRCQHLPGEHLFTYVDDAEVAHAIESSDVNAYLRETMDGDFTAKDFRTFAASVICGVELEKLGRSTTVAEAKKNVTAAITVTAKELGNTPTVCRKSYVHPAIVETYLDEFSLAMPQVRVSAKTAGLTADERRVLAFLAAAQNRDEHANRVALLERSVDAAKGAAPKKRSKRPERRKRADA